MEQTIPNNAYAGAPSGSRNHRAGKEQRPPCRSCCNTAYRGSTTTMQGGSHRTRIPSPGRDLRGEQRAPRGAWKIAPIPRRPGEQQDAPLPRLQLEQGGERRIEAEPICRSPLLPAEPPLPIVSADATSSRRYALRIFPPFCGMPRSWHPCVPSASGARPKTITPDRRPPSAGSGRTRGPAGFELAGKRRKLRRPARNSL